MKQRILSVDDDPQITGFIKRHLEGTGHFRVHVENDPRCAVAAAREFMPDLILLDVMMPEIDGAELAAQFMSDLELRAIPLVFLTALVTQKEVHAGSFMAGTRTYLPKPIDPIQLTQAIHESVRDQPATVR